MSAPFVRLRDVSVSYDDTLALDHVDLEIAVGERLAVVGESASGKSTLGLALAGLLPAGARMSGRLTWPSHGHPPLPGRDYGFVFQDAGASLNPVLTVGEQIAEVAQRHLGMTWFEAFGRARELLARVHIPDPDSALHAYPHQLSGGQRQRICIASAIAARPRLLIADEPTSALDVVVQAEVVALIQELVREDGMTLVFITHDIALASGFADSFAVFHRARLVETGPAAQVLSEPKTSYTRMLLASHIDLATPPLVEDVA
jgi:peptide/nickel transport system ATP-binding protein